MLEQLQVSSTPERWEPHKVQSEFVELPDTVFEGFYGGAAGGGKSEILYMLPLLRGFHHHPRFKGILFRRTYPELEAELILRSKPYYLASGARYNEQKRRYEWGNGAVLMFGHCEHEQDIRKYDSAQFTYVGFDELTHFSKFQYMYLVGSRCRTPDSNLPAIVRSASNPGNIGHAWVRERFVEPAREGRVILRDDLTGLKRIFIPARLFDNPYLLKSDPLYEQKLKLIPDEAERRAKLYGDWWTYEGQVFNLRWEPLPGEPANAQHVISPFEIPFWWPRVAAIDWGYTHNLWIGWAALSPEWRMYVYREYFGKEIDIAVWATDFAKISEGENIVGVDIDPSAVQKRGSETIYDQFVRHSKYRPGFADNDRVSGKMLLQDLMRWEPKPRVKDVIGQADPDLAQEILRKFGGEKYAQYMMAFEEEPIEHPIPKLQIFDTCRELTKVLPLCVYDEKNTEDVKKFDGDDAYDGMRYLAKLAMRYRKKAMKTGDKFMQVAAAQARLAASQDQTSYYRKMEAMEAEARRKSKAVLGRKSRRFGRRVH